LMNSTVKNLSELANKMVLTVVIDNMIFPFRVKLNNRMVNESKTKYYKAIEYNSIKYIAHKNTQ